MSIRSAEKYVQVKVGITIQLKVCLAGAMHGACGNTEGECSITLAVREVVLGRGSGKMLSLVS